VIEHAHVSAHPGLHMIVGDYQFRYVHFDISMVKGCYALAFGRLDHSKPHTSGFGRLSSKASLMVWGARLSCRIVVSR
jgi:hypothetical protein